MPDKYQRLRDAIGVMWTLPTHAALDEFRQEAGVRTVEQLLAERDALRDIALRLLPYMEVIAADDSYKLGTADALCNEIKAALGEEQQ